MELVHIKERIEWTVSHLKQIVWSEKNTLKGIATSRRLKEWPKRYAQRITTNRAQSK